MTHYQARNKLASCVLLLAFGVLPHLGFAERNVSWESRGTGIQESEILHIDVHPTQRQIIFASTSKGLYRSVNGGKDFELSLRPQGSAAQVNGLFIPSENTDLILAATDSGVYQSMDQGRRWEQIFNSTNAYTRRCQSVLADGDTIYIGTLKGLFCRKGNSSIWQRGKDILDKEAVFLMNRDEYYLYFITASKVYRWDRETAELDKIFSLNITSESDPEQVVDDEAVVVPDHFIKAVQILPTLLSHFYLLTTDGLFHSTDYGETWDPVNAGGIDWKEATSLAVIDGSGEPEFIIGTRHGAVDLSGEKFTSLYKGMEATVISGLASDQQGNIYAATDKGVFLLNNGQAVPSLATQTENDLKDKFSFEPSIRDVHQLAIRYAEVHPGKIEQWRAAARRKALLPTLSFGLDRSATDYFHWDTGANPDAMVKGRDFLDWDVSLSWNLGELIWNNDQTSIDSRSKLMVELREDVLDQVTRLYFERRRLQVEFLALASSQDQQLLTDKEMRLEELTALLDGFTGGEFSREIEARSKR